MRSFLATFVLVLISHSSISAAEWVSSNGAISVVEPDAKGFTKIENPPAPFQVLWVSNDEATKLGVQSIPKPPNQKLVRASIEQGFAEEFKGELTNRESRIDRDREIWTMAVKGTLNGNEVTSIQAVTEVDGIIYKAMTITTNSNVDRIAQIQKFVDSLRVKSPPVAAANNSSVAPIEDPRSFDTHNLTKLIGGASAIVLLCAVIWFAISRRRR